MKKGRDYYHIPTVTHQLTILATLVPGYLARKLYMRPLVVTARLPPAALLLLPVITMFEKLVWTLFEKKKKKKVN